MNERDPFAVAGGLYEGQPPAIEDVTPYATPQLATIRERMLDPNADALPPSDRAALARNALFELNLGTEDVTGARMFGTPADDEQNFERVREFLTTGRSPGPLADFEKATPEEQDKAVRTAYEADLLERTRKEGSASAPAYDGLTPEQKGAERAKHVQRLAEQDRGVNKAAMERLLSQEALVYAQFVAAGNGHSRIWFDRLSPSDKALVGDYTRLLMGEQPESLAGTAWRSTLAPLRQSGAGIQRVFPIFSPAPIYDEATQSFVIPARPGTIADPMDVLSDPMFDEATRPDVSQGIARQIAGSVGPSAIMLANPIIGTAGIVNERFDTLLAQGVEPERAASVAATMGAVEAAIDYVQVGKFGKTFTGLAGAWRSTAGETALRRLSGTAAKYAPQFAAGLTENTAQELVQDTLADLQPVVAGAQGAAPAGEVIAEKLDLANVVNTAAVTAGMMLIFGGPAEVARMIGPDKRAITLKDQHEATATVLAARDREIQAAASDVNALRQIVESEPTEEGKAEAIRAAGMTPAKYEAAVADEEAVASTANERATADAQEIVESLVGGAAQTDRADSAEVTRPPVDGPAGRPTIRDSRTVPDSLAQEALRVAEALGVEVRVVRSVDEVPAPVRETFQSRYGYPMDLDAVPGFYEEGVAYVSPSAVRMAGGIEGTVIHEAIGHGLERAILDDPDFVALLDDARVERILTRAGVNNVYQGETIRRAEVVARTAQTMLRVADGEAGIGLTEDERTLWRRILDWIAARFPGLADRISDLGLQRQIAEALVVAHKAKVSRGTAPAPASPIEQAQRVAETLPEPPSLAPEAVPTGEIAETTEVAPEAEAVPEVPAEPAETNVAPTDPQNTAPPAAFPVVRMRVADIAADPKRFQFKLDADAEGVQKPLDGEWDELAAGNLLVWQDAAGGFFVANGHHRLSYAKRLGVEWLNVQVLREADGVSDQDARRIAAEANIKDGKGTIYDHAEFFRFSPGYEDSAVARSRGVLGKGYSIGRLASDDLYSQFRSRAVSPDQAVTIVGAAGDNRVAQGLGILEVLDNPRMDPVQLSAFVQAVRTRVESGRAPKASATPQTEDLFGGEEDAEIFAIRDEAQEEAKVVKAAISELKDRLAAFQGTIKTEARLEAAKEAGVAVADVAKTAKARDKIALEIDLLRVNNPDAIRRARERAETGARFAVSPRFARSSPQSLQAVYERANKLFNYGRSLGLNIRFREATTGSIYLIVEDPLEREDERGDIIDHVIRVADHPRSSRFDDGPVAYDTFTGDANGARKFLRDLAKQRGGDTRFAVSRPDAPHLILSDRILKGEAPTAEDVRKLVPGASDAEAALTLAKAKATARAVEQLKADAAAGIQQTPETVRAAVDRVFAEGQTRGEYLEAARAAVAEAKRVERDAELAGIEPLAGVAPETPLADVRVATEAEAKRRGYKPGSPEWRVLYRKTLADVLRRRARELNPSTTREQIGDAIDNLGGPGSHLATTERKAAEIAARIERAAIREDRKAMLKKIDGLVRKHGKDRTALKEFEKRKIDPEVGQVYLRRVDAVLEMTAAQVEKRKQEITRLLTAMSTESAEEGAEGIADATGYETDLLSEFEVLDYFGNLAERPLSDVAEALEHLEDAIDGGLARVVAAREARKARLDAKRETLIEAIRAAGGKVPQWIRQGKWSEWATAPFTMQDRLRDLIRFAPDGATRDAAQALADQIANDMTDATYNADAEEQAVAKEFEEAVAGIYGRPARSVLNDLEKPQESLRRFSKGGRNKLSRAQVMQIVGTLQQDHYRAAAERDKSPLAPRLDMLDDMVKALRPEDLALMEWLRGYYSRARRPLSDVTKRVTGVPIRMTDPRYLPARMNAEGGLPEIHQALSIVPRSLTPRVPHGIDLDESASIVRLFAARTREAAHYKAFAELSQELRGLFAHRDFHAAASEEFGRGYKRALLEHVVDVLSQGQIRSLSLGGAADFAYQWAAITSLGLNLRTAFAQPSGGFSFIHELGFGGFAKAVADSFTPQGIEATKALVRSEEFRSRYGRGQSEAMAHVLNSRSANQVAQWLRNTVLVQGYGESLQLFVVGGGVLRTFMESPKAKAMTREDAERWAIRRVFQVMDANQQSRFVKDANVWIRRGGPWARLGMMFTGPAAIQFAKEVRAWRDFLAKPGLESLSPAIRTTLVNHALTGALFVGMKVVYDALLGDEPDDADRAMLWAALWRGQIEGFGFEGLMAAGAIDTAAGLSTYGRYDLAATRINKDAAKAAEALGSLFSGDFDDFEEDAAALARAILPIFRDAEKLYENRIED